MLSEVQFFACVSNMFSSAGSAEVLLIWADEIMHCAILL